MVLILKKWRAAFEVRVVVRGQDVLHERAEGDVGAQLVHLPQQRDASVSPPASRRVIQKDLIQNNYGDCVLVSICAWRQELNRRKRRSYCATM